MKRVAIWEGLEIATGWFTARDFESPRTGILDLLTLLANWGPCA